MKQHTNVLLSKGQLGKVKPGFHKLPQEGHTYGWQPEKDKYGARQVISNWQLHKPSGVGQPSKDFKQLNKLGAISGCTNAKDIGKFRGTSDVRVKVKQGQKFFDIRLPPEDFVYGVSNRPSTPIKNVICNNYAKEFDEAQKEKQAVLKMVQQKEPQVGHQNVQKQQKVSVNKNRKEQIQKNNFKLQKFKNVQSKVKGQIQRS